MTSHPKAVLLLGGSGYLGSEVLARLLASDSALRVLVLVRDRVRWMRTASRYGADATRITAFPGDVRAPGLGMSAADRDLCAREATHVIHSAGDLVLSRSLEDARATNTAGTAHMLDVVSECALVERLVYVSTTYVAGKATGIVLERDNGASCGFVNGYEQSKYEAETLVRGASVPWVIARPSMLICDDPCGAVSQLNASHYTIRLWRAALVPMLPGSDESLMDVVSRDDVASSIIQLLHHPSAAGVTAHLSGGPRTLRLKDVMELAWETWREDAAWRRCAIPVPALVDLETYSLLEQAIAETADPLLQRIVRSIAAFARTNAYPKSYDTRVSDALLHREQADPVTLWRTVFEHIARKARARVAA